MCNFKYIRINYEAKGFFGESESRQDQRDYFFGGAEEIKRCIRKGVAFVANPKNYMGYACLHVGVDGFNYAIYSGSLEDVTNGILTVRRDMGLNSDEPYKMDTASVRRMLYKFANDSEEDVAA